MFFLGDGVLQTENGLSLLTTVGILVYQMNAFDLQRTYLGIPIHYRYMYM